MAVVSGGVVYGLTALARVSSIKIKQDQHADDAEILGTAPSATFDNSVSIDFSGNNSPI